MLKTSAHYPATSLVTFKRHITMVMRRYYDDKNLLITSTDSW